MCKPEHAREKYVRFALIYGIGILLLVPYINWCCIAYYRIRFGETSQAYRLVLDDYIYGRVFGNALLAVLCGEIVIACCFIIQWIARRFGGSA